MKQLKITFLLLLFSCFTENAFSQSLKSFGREPEVFIKELKSMMYEDKIEPAMQVFDAFKVLWDSNRFDAYQQARIIKNGDKMLMKRMKTHPHFTLYLETLTHFAESGKMPDLFVQWQKTLESYYEAKTKDFLNFLEVSNSMFAGNIFIESRAQRLWKSSDNTYTLDRINGEPAFVFERTTLTCVTRDDSLSVFNTKGYYLMETHVWKGFGGKIDWTRGGYGPDEVFAILKNYEINMEGNKYTADSVTFYQKDFFKAPLLGSIEDVALATSTPEGIRYPKFYSYRKDLDISEFAAEVEYVGGFSQQGSKVIAYGDGSELATFTFFYKNKPFIILRGREFVVTDDRIVTDKAALEINLDTGSVFHPQVIFNYVKSDKKVLCSRGDIGVSQAPFTDTYHRIELKADKMEWIMGQPKIDFRTILKDGSVLLYSENYFKEFDYEKLQGMQAENPLSKIKQFCEQTGKRKFHLDEYIAWRRSKREYVRFQIVQLTDEGYLMLDSETDTIVVNDKLFNAVNAHMGRTDYDVIFFESIIEKRANATIDLESYSMNLEGVGRFFFSDSQYVYVVPTEQQVTILRNRELVFDGKVRAGRFEFFGQRMRFNYNSFTVDMDDIDSMRFFFPDSEGSLRRINSVLQDITGTLFIDNPSNKSGRKNFPEYPIFKATKGSKVYYDYPYIYNGVYDRERFYFATDPFIIDSLDNFTKEGLRFGGNFVSADIFPDFKEELTVQEDYSLGFKKVIDMPTYQGTGQARVNISLSNQGLLGKGEVEFATLKNQSQDIVFFPDSMNAISESFMVPESANYPKVEGINVITHWEPYNDKFVQRSTDAPILMFGDVKLKGEYIHRQKGSEGDGNLDFNDADIQSNNMHFDNKRMWADTSTLTIRSIDTNKFAFRAVNVKSDVDFTKRFGDFKSNVNGANSEFPYNQYKSSLNEFKWDIKKKQLKFNTPEDRPIESTYFVSTHPDQDSLKFSSRKALYDLNTFTLYANEVPHIDVADSRVLPDSGKVVIRADAAMDPLLHSRIIMDTVNKWHEFYECNTTIFGRLNMGANGFYDYISKDGKKNTINAHEIKVDYVAKTALAYAHVYDTMHFTMTTRFEFKGDMTLKGSYRGAKFDGYVHPVQALTRPSSGWWRENRSFVPDSVLFHIEDPYNEDKKPMKLGMWITLDSIHTYPSFFTLGRNYSDSAIVKVREGIVYFNEADETFYAGDSLKLKAGAVKGNIISLNDKTGVVHAEGKTDLGVNTGFVKMNTAGNATFLHKDSSMMLDLMMLLDFPLPQENVKFMTDKMIENGIGLNATYNNRPMVKNALAELLEEKEYTAAMEEIKLGGIPISKNLEGLLFISEIKLVWDQNRKAYVSEGPIGITSVGNTKFEKKVEGKMMIERKRSGDEITLYFQTDDNHWYFINYLRNNLYIYSSESEFNNLVREKYSEVSKDGYTLKLASPRAKIKFLNSFEPAKKGDE